jgi:hypothetical protein
MIIVQQRSSLYQSTLPLATKQTQFEMGRSLRELQDMNKEERYKMYLVEGSECLFV